MRLLLDANAIIWGVDDPGKLGSEAVVLLADSSHERWISAGTIWEISIKIGLGKLTLSQPFRAWIAQAINDLAANQLPISIEHADSQASLPRIHGDPFDRLLVAQAMVEGMEIVSIDAVFDQYGAKRRW